jgi:hypothetical protein
MADMNSRGQLRLWFALLLLCAIGAAAAIRRIAALVAAPPAGPSPWANLDAHFGAKPGTTLTHIVPSLAFVLFVPLQFVSSLRQRHPKLHQWIGRVLICLGIVTGISALWLSAHPIGGIVEGTATTFYGCFFLFSLSRAWLHIRNRRVELHREWVIRMVAIALGAAATRPIMAIFFATSRVTWLSPEQFFGSAMWLGFTASYVAGELWIRHTRPRTTRVPCRKREEYLRRRSDPKGQQGGPGFQTSDRQSGPGNGPSELPSPRWARALSHDRHGYPSLAVAYCVDVANGRRGKLRSCATWCWLRRRAPPPTGARRSGSFFLRFLLRFFPSGRFRYTIWALWRRTSG